MCVCGGGGGGEGGGGGGGGGEGGFIQKERIADNADLKESTHM